MPVNHLSLKNLILDSDFEKILPLFSGQEYKALEQRILHSKTPPNIFTWNRRIIKGLTEYKICRAFHLPFSITEKNDLSRTKITAWICLESIKTQTLSKKQMRYCIGRLYDSEKKTLAERSHLEFPDDYPKDPCTGRNSSRIHTANLLKDVFPISPVTVYMYGTYASSVDEIDRKAPGLAKELLTDQFRISCKDTRKLSGFSSEEILLIRKKITEENNPALLRSKEKCQSLTACQSFRKNPGKNQPDIKKMPPYDPNAEISSLTLTIPMWINAMNRPLSGNGFCKASPLALESLSRQLHLLEQQIHCVQKKIKEKQHA